MKGPGAIWASEFGPDPSESGPVSTGRDARFGAKGEVLGCCGMAGLREAAGLRGPRAETDRKQGIKWRKGMSF
jgi:hypothetical protein